MLTVGAICDQAWISGPLSCEAAGGLPAMMSARSLFIMSVVKPETGLCCQVAPALVTSSPKAFIASPSAPADQCEMTVILGSASTRAPDIVSAQATTTASNDLFSMVPSGRWLSGLIHPRARGQLFLFSDLHRCCTARPPRNSIASCQLYCQQFLPVQIAQIMFPRVERES